MEQLLDHGDNLVDLLHRVVGFEIDVILGAGFSDAYEVLDRPIEDT